MDEEERRDIRALISEVARYREYAYQNYLTGCENYAAIKQLASDVVYGPTNVDKNMVYVDTRRYGDMDEYTARHMMVMAVIDYLSGNKGYTFSRLRSTRRRRGIMSTRRIRSSLTPERGTACSSRPPPS